MEMRLLRADETHLTIPCVAALAVYHNGVSTNHEVTYPTTSPEHCAEVMAEGIRTNSGKTMGVFDDDKLIAFCQITIWAEKRRGELSYLFVNDEYRGLGLGKKLIDWAMEEFEQSPADMVDIRVVEGNPTETLYERYDFHRRISVMTWFKKK